jgi:putative transcriptional regulator
MIVINLDVVMAQRKMSLTELSEEIGITMANLSKLKNQRARAIRFTTLNSICEVLDCEVGEIMEYKKEEETK